jgi:hypothetical protein
MQGLAKNASPMTLLFHDGELGDVRELLGRLGAPFVERQGALLPEDRERDFGLAIATPQRMLSIRLDPNRPLPTQIAICDSDTRSLRNSLRRAGIQLMVRRPVHPAALRAIVLHSLYRGPERRRSVRVSIGAPVRFRSGWRQRPAVLADLSVGGFRLLSPHPIEPGCSIKLIVPAEVSGDRAFSLRGRVLRNLPGPGTVHTLTARLENPRPRQIEAIKGVLKAHASGPARFDPEELPELNAAPETAGPAAPASGEGASQAGERRSAPRHAIDRRVIALGDAATRVLMGRDISLGGMRVNPSPLLQVGDDVRLAIHVAGQDAPLVLTARVHRDDGERGVVLRFHELDREASRLLDSMLDSLPIVEPGGPPAAPGLIVSEILARAQ